MKKINLNTKWVAKVALILGSVTLAIALFVITKGAASLLALLPPFASYGPKFLSYFLSCLKGLEDKKTPLLIQTTNDGSLPVKPQNTYPEKPNINADPSFFSPPKETSGNNTGNDVQTNLQNDSQNDDAPKFTWAKAQA